jgi:putative membrane protein
MKKIKGYAALAAIALVAIVIFQNTEAVETKVLLMTIVMPRAALLAVTLLIGIAVGIFFGWKLSRPKPSLEETTK